MPPRCTTLRKCNQPRLPTMGTAMLKTPPENAVMMGPAHALAIRLNPPSPHKALYPPCGQHPSDSAVQRYHTAKATASQSRSAPRSPHKQHCTTKLPVSRSRSAGRFTSKIPHQGRSPTPSKMVYSIFHSAPSTASTSSLTQGSLSNPGLIEGSSMNSSLNNPSTLSTRKTPLRSQSITQGLNERQSLSPQRLVEDRVHRTDILQPDKSPPLSALNLPTTSSSVCSRYLVPRSLPRTLAMCAAEVFDCK